MIPLNKGKVQVGNNQEKSQSERISHSKNRDGKNTLTIRYLYMYLENMSRAAISQICGESA